MTSTEKNPDNKHLWEQWAAFLGFVILGFSLGWIGIVTQFIPLDDEIGHLLVSRDGWHSPRLIFNTWGRTVNTLAYMPIAAAPLWAARLWAAGMTVAASFFAWDFARRAGLRTAWTVPWFMAAQPAVLEGSWQALTLQPLMLAGMALLWTGSAGYWKTAAMLAGCLPLIRHETIVLTGLFGLICLWRRKIYTGALAAVPILLNFGAAWLFFGDNPLSIFFSPKPTEVYGSGDWTSLARPFINGTGSVLLIMAVIGGAAVRNSALTALAVFTSVYFSIHAILFRFGLYATGGYAILLLALAPGIALLGSFGFDWFIDVGIVKIITLYAKLSDFRKPLKILIGALILSAVGAWAFTFHSIGWADEQNDAIDQGMAWLKSSPYSKLPAEAAHVRFYYFMPRPIPVNPWLWMNSRPLESLPADTIVFRDAKYGDMFGFPKEKLETPMFERLWASSDERVIIYRKKF